MRYRDDPPRDNMEEKAKPKRKAKSKQAYVVVDEQPPKQEHAPLDHELTPSGKGNSGGGSFAQGCAVGGIFVICILLFLCMLVMRGLSPVFESMAELLSLLN